LAGRKTAERYDWLGKNGGGLERQNPVRQSFGAKILHLTLCDSNVNKPYYHTNTLDSLPIALQNG
jgi:hypothetical protein